VNDAVNEAAAERPHRPLLHRPYLGLGAGLALLGAFVLLTLAVGSQASRTAPATALAAVGRMDQRVYDATQHINDNGLLTPLAKVLNVMGSGIFNIPLRTAALILLLVLRRYRHAIAFALTWLVSELAMTGVKAMIDRARPPHPLVVTHGASYPSGHSVAGAAIGIALVIAFIPAGHQRRVWEWAAAAFALLMGMSRVYLNAHWFADALGGVLLGAGVALTVAALVALTDRRVMGHTPHDEIPQEQVKTGAPPLGAEADPD
jgi:membrane-associated phospholipid phosphatase